jgi:hypothetical protein
MKNQPKYQIGQTVYYLKDSTVKAEMVLGIFSSFDRDRYYNSTKPAKFLTFLYSFEVSKDVSQYGWIEESKLFITKELLLASL